MLMTEAFNLGLYIGEFAMLIIVLLFTLVIILIQKILSDRKEAELKRFELSMSDLEALQLRNLKIKFEIFKREERLERLKKR